MTQLVNWQEGYSVGVSVIDEQHRRFIQIINKLYDAFIQKEQEDVIGEIINELSNYAINHFKTEEQLFAETGYPASEQHIAEHRKFIKQVEQFRYDFRMNSKAITSEIMFFLKDWLGIHISKMDKLYVLYFHEHGIT